MPRPLAIGLAASLLSLAWLVHPPADNPAAAHISAADILATIENAPEGRVSDLPTSWCEWIRASWWS